MNGLDVIRGVVDTLKSEEVLRMEFEKQISGSTEQRNIDPKQISSGSGTMENTPYSVPGMVANLLNDIPNPDRNGLVLLWAYNIDKIYSGREDGMMDFVKLLYQLGEIQYSKGDKGKKGKKKKDEGSSGATDVFDIKAEDMGLTSMRPQSMSNTSDSEYERIVRFVNTCMIPSIDSFQKRWSAGILYKTVNFRNLALNLLKGVREVMIINQSL
jgi:hypothetical protein